MLNNASIAELLILEAEMTERHREVAYRRAAHSAFMWPVEAVEVVNAGLSLIELVRIALPDCAGLGELAKRPLKTLFDLNQ